MHIGRKWGEEGVWRNLRGEEVGCWKRGNGATQFARCCTIWKRGFGEEGIRHKRFKKTVQRWTVKVLQEASVVPRCTHAAIGTCRLLVISYNTQGKRRAHYTLHLQEVESKRLFSYQFDFDESKLSVLNFSPPI